MKLINIMMTSLDGRIASSVDELDSDRMAKGFYHPFDWLHLKEQLFAADAVVISALSLSKAHKDYFELQFPQDKKPPSWWVLSRSGLSKEFVQKWPLAWELNNVIGGENIARTTLEQIKNTGAKRILLLGGGKINSLFYQEDLVDELYLTVFPRLLGDGVGLIAEPLRQHLDFSLQEVKVFGSVVVLHMIRKKFHDVIPAFAVKPST